MRATTVRFGEDLWSKLEQEAGAAGVSVAQYVRDAALIRVTWELLQRGAGEYSEAAALVDDAVAQRVSRERPAENSERLREETLALRAQASHIQRRSAELLKRASGESSADR